MEIDIPSLDLEKAEKVTKAAQFFGLLGLTLLTFLLTRWRTYAAARPRKQIAELKTEVESLKKLIGELTKSVGANSTNIVDLAGQLQGIVGDADRKLAVLRSDQEVHFVRVGVHEDLCDRVGQLDERLWQLGGIPERRGRSREPAKREAARHDPGDR